jgi:AsmA protein
MVKVGGISGKIELWPLLSGTLVVDRLVITEPELNLQVDGAQQPNWEMKPGSSESAQAEKSTEPPFSNVRLGDVRIERGKFTYSDAATGQDLTGRDLNVGVSMPDLAQPLAAKVSLVLNEEPATFDMSVDTPQAVMTGKPATFTVALDSKHITFRVGGKAAQGAASGFAGVLDLNVPSVGQLAAWLDRPLDRGQPDPGSLKMNAEFDAAPSGVVLKTATIQGSGLSATASGTVETANGDVQKLVFKLDGGVLDFDRYLPKSAPAAARPASSTTRSAASNTDPFAALPDSKFDLAPLRSKEIDIQVKLQGIKASGLEIGRIDLGAQMNGGRLDAAIREVQLYGGKIAGQTKLDASGETLALDTRLVIDKVNVGTLARAAAKGAGSPIAGIATGTATASGNGASPRALAQSLVGNIAFDISGADVRDAAIKISAVKLAMALPGIDKQPTIKASATYNGQPVTVDVITDTTRKVLGEDRFQLTTTIGTPFATVKYSGAAIRQPAPALDGKFDIAVTSVGRLLNWVGTPLAPGQQDPGLLNVSAVMTGDGGKATLKEAQIDGKAIKATAKGTFDLAKAIPEFDAQIIVEQADLNAYMPAQPKAPAGATAAQPQTTAAAGWSEEPIDVAFLSRAKGKIEAQFKSVRYRDLVIESGRAEGTLANGALNAAVQDVSLAKGAINASVGIAPANNGLTLDYQASASDVQAQPLLTTFAGTDRLSGTAQFTAKGNAKGRSQKDLIGALNGEGSFKFSDGAIHGINIAALLRQAKTLGFDPSARDTQKTDFAELSGTFVIRDGVLENNDMKMLAPVLRLAGSGQVPMPPRTINYNVTATLVGTLQGQGGDAGLNGLPIPILVSGGWDAPSYKVDWQAVFRDAAKDPERLKSLPANLQQTAKGLGIAIPGLADSSKLPGVLQGLSGLGGKQSTPEAQKDGAEPAKPDIGQTFRNLFGK